MEYQSKEKFVGTWKNNTIEFTREWSGYRFSDEECKLLLEGKTIVIEAVSKKTGSKFSVCGKLGEQEYNGKQFIGFIPDFNKKIVPISFLGHVISDKERKDLTDGKEIFVKGLTSKKGNSFDAWLKFDSKEGMEMRFE